MHVPNDFRKLRAQHQEPVGSPKFQETAKKIKSRACWNAKTKLGVHWCPCHVSVLEFVPSCCLLWAGGVCQEEAGAAVWPDVGRGSRWLHRSVARVDLLQPLWDFHALVCALRVEQEVRGIIPWVPACGARWLWIFHYHMCGASCVEGMPPVWPSECGCRSSPAVRDCCEAYGACYFIFCCCWWLTACVPQMLRGGGSRGGDGDSPTGRDARHDVFDGIGSWGGGGEIDGGGLPRHSERRSKQKDTGNPHEKQQHTGNQSRMQKGHLLRVSLLWRGACAHLSFCEACFFFLVLAPVRN